MSSDPTLNKEYLPLSGMKAFTEGCTKLLLGESCLAITQNRVCNSHRKIIVWYLRTVVTYAEPIQLHPRDPIPNTSMFSVTVLTVPSE